MLVMNEWGLWSVGQANSQYFPIITIFAKSEEFR